MNESTDMLEHAESARSRRRLRTALVISNLEYGGAERQVVELANHLHDEDCQAHVVSLSAYVPLANSLNQENAPLHVVERRHKFDVGVIGRLATLLRSLDIEVVHGFLFDAEIVSRIAGRLARVPVIVGSERNADYQVPLKKRIAYRLTNSAMDVCIANSEAGARHNARVMGLSEHRYRVVRNGVDLDRFAPSDGREVRRELGISDDSFCAAIFGSFKPQKNHAMFVEAAAKFLESGRKATLLFVGDQLEQGRRGSSDHHREIMDAVRSSGIAPACVFTGNRDDVERLYRACDVVVLPSLHEGTPNVALEALASGVPVIATDVSDNARVLQHGETGFLVQVGDSAKLAEYLALLHDDDDLRARLCTGARNHAEQFYSLKRLAVETVAVYREFLADKLGRGVV